MWGMIMSLLQGLGQQSSTQSDQTGMGSLFSFDKGGGPGGMVGGRGYSNPSQFGGSKPKAFWANTLNPLGIGLKKDKEEPPTLEEQLDQMMNWQRSQPEYQAYQGELDEMGEDPNYGAIQPDWGEIWDDYSSKISQTYWGSPTDPGIAGKMRASVARRGVEDSPAEQELLSRIGAEEAGDLQTLGTQQGIQRTNLVSSAKKDYLNRLGLQAGQAQITNFADLLPMFLEEDLPEKPDYSWMEGIGSGLSDMLSKKKKPAAVGGGTPLTQYGRATPYKSNAFDYNMSTGGNSYAPTNRLNTWRS